VHEETGLAFSLLWQGEGSPRRPRKTVNVALVSNAAFEQASDEARRTTAAAALRRFAKLIATRRDLQGPPRLLILRTADGAPGWLYEDGKLVADEAPGTK